jgi:hypothetical protein
MQKILIFIFVFSFSFLKAQNLQISQVKNLSFSGGVPATSASVLGNVVVPVGKVLKIESSSFSLTNNGLPEDEGSYPKFSAFIDRHQLYTNSGFQRVFFPIWLPSGTYDVVVESDDSSFGSTFVKISAIEFDIVP